MFQKKDYIYSETMGVCRVDDVTNLAVKHGTPIPYYVLRSVYQKDKVAYIPVEHHAVSLRELITREEALQLQEQWKSETDQPEIDRSETESETNQPPQNDDTLERDLLYRKGEVEFVLAREEKKTVKKEQ
jgi:hypothetical protein